MLDVLFVTQTASANGGVERWLDDLSLGLGKKGLRVAVALVDGPRFHHSSQYLNLHPALLTLPCYRVQAGSGIALARRRALQKVIKATRPAVIVPVLVHEVLSVLQASPLQQYQPKVIYPLHENELWAFDAVAKHQEAIDAVISVNQLMLDALQTWADVPASACWHIRGGVECAGQWHRSAHKEAKLRIGYCGNLVQRQKRVLDLIDFCRRMDELEYDYCLSIVGIGGMLPDLKLGLATQIDAGRVKVLGRLGRTELYADFYRNIDVLLITSDWETGPLVAWEAMMHGVVVLTSAYLGQRREGVLQDGDTALVFPIGEPQQAADKLIAFARDGTKLESIGEQGRRFAERRLGVERMVAEWRGAIERVTASSPKRRSPGTPSTWRLGSALERIEDLLRRMLKRPIISGTSHGEWPRYHPGQVTDQDRAAFLKRLSALETHLPSAADRVANGAPIAGNLNG